MSDPVRIAIIMDGGNIQAVLTAGVPVEYVTVDYDVDGSSDDETREVPQGDGTTERAFVHANAADSDGPFVVRAFELAADNNRCTRCGADLDNPSAAGAEDGICGECIESAIIGAASGSYATAPTLARYDAGEINDEQAIAEMQAAGWSEQRAYTILEQHQNA